MLSAQEQQDEDNAINSDIYSFFVDPVGARLAREA